MGDPEVLLVAWLAEMASDRRSESVPVPDTEQLWSEVIALAEAERVAPIILAWLLNREDVPASARAALEAAARRIGLLNAMLVTELSALLRGLSERAVQVIVLKGAALGSALYGGPHLRALSDVDVLIRDEALEAASRYLIEQGYVPERPEYHPGWLSRYEAALTFRKVGRVPIAIELHWRLLDSTPHRFAIDSEWLWASSQAFEVRGVPARMLGTSALMIHLCAHLLLHHPRDRGLLWRHDVALILARWSERLDWSEIVSRAREFELLSPVATLVPEVARRWGLNLDSHALEALSSARPSPREERLLRVGRSLDTPAERFVSDVRGLEHWPDRVEYVASRLFPSPAYMRERYGLTRAWGLPLAYSYRWLGAALEAARHAKSKHDERRAPRS